MHSCLDNKHINIKPIEKTEIFLMLSKLLMHGCLFFLQKLTVCVQAMKGVLAIALDWTGASIHLSTCILPTTISRNLCLYPVSGAEVNVSKEDSIMCGTIYLCQSAGSVCTSTPKHKHY